MLNYLHTRKDNFNSGKINYKDEKDIASCVNASSKSIDVSDNIIKSKSRVQDFMLPTTPTITANYAKQPTDIPYLKIKSATKKGYEVAGPGDSINLEHLNSETRRGRVGNGVANTLDTGCNQGVLMDAPRLILAGQLRGEKWDKNHEQSRRYYNTNGLGPTVHTMGGRNQEPKILNADYRIRRLTPVECLRLMDFPADYKITVSDTQAYKQAGNSVVVSVIYHILKKLPI